MRLSSDSTVCGLNILHEGNHNSNKNPHEQYIYKFGNCVIYPSSTLQTYDLYEINYCQDWQKNAILFTAIDSENGLYSTFLVNNVFKNSNSFDCKIKELQSNNSILNKNIRFRIEDNKIIVFYYKSNNSTINIQTNCVIYNDLNNKDEIKNIFKDSNYTSDYISSIPNDYIIPSISFTKGQNKYMKLFDVEISQNWAEKNIKFDLLTDAIDASTLIYGSFLIGIKRSSSVDDINISCVMLDGIGIEVEDICFEKNDKNISCYFYNRINCDVTMDINSLTQNSYKQNYLYVNNNLIYVDSINKVNPSYSYASKTLKDIYTFNDSGEKVKIKVNSDGTLYTEKI